MTDNNTNNSKDTVDSSSATKSTNTIKQYEYLSHTADIQLHSWGSSFTSALSNICIAMFDYISNIDLVDLNNKDRIHSYEFDIESDDIQACVYNTMDEFLFRFVTNNILVGKIDISSITVINHDSNNSSGSDNDNDNDNNNNTTTTIYKLHITAYGELFDLDKHTQGTEIKAITYSNMKIYNDNNRWDIYVIVDI